MLLNDMKQMVLNHCPNIPFVAKALAKARIYSFERYLLSEDEITLGEKDAEAKEKIVERRAARFPSYMNLLKKQAEEILALAPAYVNRDDIANVKTDIFFCAFAYGFSPEEYVFFRLEGKSMQDKLAYVSHTKRICAGFRMNDLSSVQLLNDKWKTYELLKPYFKRDAISISRTGHFPQFEAFVNEHPVFVKKQVNLSCGESVAKIDINTCGKGRKALFNEMISAGKTILEELIVQRPEMAVFNPESVNTVRCVTMNTRHGIKILAPSFIRNGRKGSFVDNGGAGGIFAGIDNDTGKIMTDGYDEFGSVFTEHPDSGAVFKDYQIPEWEKMLVICKELASYLPRMKYCGWDMAYTDKGWVIVEGNRIGQLVAQQTTIGHGIKAELDALMSDMDLFV